MIALLGREFVNLPLLCGVAGRSRDSSGPPARGAFSLRWFTVCQGAASICVCPFFFIPHWVSSLCFLRSTAVSSYPLPSLALSPSEWPMPRDPPSGPEPVGTPPHCVLPEASARTRCCLMAFSRNPATFSLSSYKATKMRSKFIWEKKC